MSTHNGWLAALALALSISPGIGASAQSPAGGGNASPATPAEIAGWNIDVTPDGAGLPAGSGTPAEGGALFAARCAACHGIAGQGIPVPGHGMLPRLVGGIGTLKDNLPVKTLGSFWPFTTIVFDYIRRAMPLDHPQSLSADQVYALTAFLLWKNGIIAEDTAMSAQSLPAVEMPNAHGFFTRPAPETADLPAIMTAPFRLPGNAGH